MESSAKTVLEDIIPLLEKLKKRLQMLKKNDVLIEIKGIKGIKEIKGIKGIKEIKGKQTPKQQVNIYFQKRLTYKNAYLYIGKVIKFNTKNGFKNGILKNVSKSGKTIHIIQGEKQRTLENVRRKILVVTR